MIESPLLKRLTAAMIHCGAREWGQFSVVIVWTIGRCPKAEFAPELRRSIRVLFPVIQNFSLFPFFAVPHMAFR
jgi:hypothetical protein